MSRCASASRRFSRPFSIFQFPQAFSPIRFHAAVLGSPLVKAGRAEATLAAQLRARHARFDLLQDANDLLGGESTGAHVRPRQVDGLYSALRGTALREQVLGAHKSSKAFGKKEVDASQPIVGPVSQLR